LIRPDIHPPAIGCLAAKLDFKPLCFRRRDKAVFTVRRTLGRIPVKPEQGRRQAETGLHVPLDANLLVVEFLGFKLGACVAQFEELVARSRQEGFAVARIG
jgi:hypothetical protein